MKISNVKMLPISSSNSNWKLATLVLATLATMATFAKTFPWRITGNDATAARFAAYQGESVAFDVSFSGAASNCTAQSAKIYYQTNGMDRAWWQTDGLVFAPSNDVGATSYRFFIRAADDLGANYTANGVLRMLPSPGFEPAVLAPPVQRLDFANIEVANAPYYTKAETDAAIAAIPGGGVSTNEVFAIVGPTIAAAQADFAATGTVYRAASLYDGGAQLVWRSTGGAQSPMRWGVYEPPSGGFSVFRPLAYLSELEIATNATLAAAFAYTDAATAGGGPASGLELVDENDVAWTLGVNTNGTIFTYIKETNP